MSQPGEKPDARRLARAAFQSDSARDRLYVMPLQDGQLDPHASGIWHGDPDSLSPDYTTVADWPTPKDFAPLIKAAREAGNLPLVHQLLEDQRYCTAMRRKIRSADRLSQGRRQPAS
jgi:hypothetical protein